MKVAIFDTHRFEKPYLERAFGNSDLKVEFIEAKLTEVSVMLAKDFDVVCCFVNDTLNQEVICQLACNNIKLIALRCAGFNNVDLHAAAEHGISVVRVPNYSPHAVAEHAMALVLALNRKIHRAHQRTRELNFSLDGLVGFDLHRKVAGVLGTGKIGAALIKILLGFGCTVLAFDRHRNAELEDAGVKYCDLEPLLERSDIISVHLPLTPESHHIIGEKTLSLLKPNALIVNTSRGALVDSVALIDALKQKRIGGAALDVYEEEADIFFEDFSEQVLNDDVLARLLTFPNVIITAHQAFLTKEALEQISLTTVKNIQEYKIGARLKNAIPTDLRVKPRCSKH